MTKDELEEKVYKALKDGDQMDYDREDSLAPFYNYGEVRDNVVLLADDYAKQVSISFSEWVERNYAFTYGSYEAIDPITTRIVLPHIEYTIQQLYEIFIQQYNP